MPPTAPGACTARSGSRNLRRARERYDALTDAQKQYVTRLEELKAAEEYYRTAEVEKPTEPSQPQKPEETIEIPKTGDHACLPLWISLCGVCAAQMAGLFLYKRKNRRM